jgi:hypothetical protein
MIGISALGLVALLMMKEVPMTGKEQGEFGLVEEKTVREDDETSLKSIRGKAAVAVSTSA